MKKFDVSAAVIGRVVRTLLATKAAKVTCYLSPTLTCKASRVVYGKSIDNGGDRADVRVTVGVPNYAERKAIKLFKRAGEPFPVKKLAIRYLPTS